MLREFANIVNLDWSERQRIHTARLLESRSLLADVMVRTRKREAFPKRVVRKPWVLSVSLSPEEQQLYQNLSDRIRTVARRQNPGTPGEFVLIGRQRQLASCIPAALAAWRESGHLDELLWEALGAELGQPDGGFPDVPLDDLMSGYDFELRTKSHGRFGGERQLELPIPIPESANMGQVAPATNGPLTPKRGRQPRRPIQRRRQ